MVVPWEGKSLSLSGSPGRIEFWTPTGQVKLEGAIDNAGVRAEIAAVMEGGEKAFRLRKEKYGF